MIYLDFIKLDDKKREKIVEEFCEKILSRKRKIGPIDNWCKKYLKMNLQKEYVFKDIIKANPEELMELKTYLDNNYDVSGIMEDLCHVTGNGNERCYIVDTLYKAMDESVKSFLINSLGVTVCPYCNRNYVYSKESVNTCDLDHFLPKDKYPIFAVSFYNLIPVCPVCNRKKHDNIFWFYPHHKERQDDVLKFSYHLKGSDFLTNLEQIEVDIEVQNSKYNTQLEKLQLQDIYKHHNDIVQDILKKKQVFSDDYIENFCNEFPQILRSKKEVEEMIYGISMDERDYGKRPLSKLTQDILSDLK